MSTQLNKQEQTIKIFNILLWLVIATGIVLRLVLWFQNRNLIIDEANVVRNLYERDFAGLVKPLSYEQYAPPIFLWMEELATLLFGYGEKAVRLFPLLCGIASLFIFRQILLRFMSPIAAWYPLALLAFTYLPIKYSVEVKQYMPDVLITLLLIWITLKTDILTKSRWRFVTLWTFTGIIAIASSMPSVFILTGVGCYYFITCIQHKSWNKLLNIVIPAIFWLVCFGIYYYTILKPQAESDYLQNFHAPYFLFVTPSSTAEWAHNWERISQIIANAGGYTAFSLILNILLIITSIVVLLRKNARVLALTFLPFILTLIAAAFNKFTLIDRVILFLLPLLQILIGVGFNFYLKPQKMVYRIPIWVLGIVTVVGFNSFWLFERSLREHELTEGFDYLIEKGVKGNRLYVHEASKPTYLYYTKIHPKRERYKQIYGAHTPEWFHHYAAYTDSVTADTIYLIATGGWPQSERDRRFHELDMNFTPVDTFEKYICFVYTLHALPPEERERIRQERAQNP